MGEQELMNRRTDIIRDYQEYIIYSCLQVDSDFFSFSFYGFLLIRSVQEANYRIDPVASRTI